MEAVVSALRAAAALLVAAAAGLALYFFCVLPYRCNVVKKARLGVTNFAFANGATAAGRMAARRNLDAFGPCLNDLCRDVSVDMLAAANYRVVNRPDEAIRLYRDALRRDTRPEIYVNLAAAELMLGDRRAARDHALRATLFNTGMIAEVDDGLLRAETAAALIRLHPEKADLIRYFQNFGATQ
jgi:tetratricopeptide (TPR) repeat protein